MPGSFVSNYVHIVFSTRDRANLIHLSLQTALFDVMIHLAGEMNCPVIAIGGMPNHVHILLSLHQDCRISYTVRDIKAESSHWLHDHGVEFAWQS